MDKNSINIKILKVKMTDIDLLQSISQQTFIEAFSETNTAENMTKYMAEKFSNETLLAELSNRGSEFYFAQLGNRIIGYLKINSEQAQTELQDEHALEIERIYVLQEFHGKKVGQLLYEKALDIARLKNVRFIWLGVWEENHRAISFYNKNGFVAFDKHIFRLGDDEQTDIMMKKSVINN
ncbi:GNAT family N-acetyltransferase [Sphingobacterium detergens]|uniref:Ribosomal protein S18 acetylase RimI-like enzyme n=1 Tax=Sphingobacterium detergens TaxID=1145106 RepID=A0A420BKV6_SPHD1|nr:GNAT family N-acetyltransferase [Sphingobacterium detergens]RKE57431.1 ribosomal protein S18 acetylase RimI-like enzyme [Sphingobacterium detergens]